MEETLPCGWKATNQQAEVRKPFMVTDTSVNDSVKDQATDEQLPKYMLSRILQKILALIILVPFPLQ